MAITVTPEDVSKLAPEYAETEDETVEPFIELARSFVNEGKWGSKAKHAICLMTAHLMKEIGIGDDESSSNAGPVTSEKVGDLQRSYGNSQLAGGSVSDQLLTSTKYGKQFLMLRKTLVKSPLVV